MSTKATDPYGLSRSSSVILAITLIVFFFPLDGVISRSLQGVKLGPDFRVELQTMQQYGQLSSIVLGMAIIWLLDPLQRKRLADWLAAVGVTSLFCFLLKICTGRPRPKFDAPTTFVGVWDAHPFFSAKADDIIHKYSWDITARHPWDLWSMPSSHTALAAVMSVFLASLYPRLRPFCLAMVVLVGCCRVLFRDHYPTDVVVGAVVGHVIASHVIAASWGRRVIAWGMPKRRSAKAPPKALPVSVEGGRYAK